MKRRGQHLLLVPGWVFGKKVPDILTCAWMHKQDNENPKAATLHRKHRDMSTRQVQALGFDLGIRVGSMIRRIRKR